MSSVAPAVRGTRALGWAAAAASVGYVVVTVLMARNVTFYWDDYFLLLALDDRGFGGALLTGINGNWWPLATAGLWLQLAAFGGWYPAYLAMNAVLVVASAWAAWFALSPLVRRRPWVLAAALACYACSLGLVVNVTVMTMSWPLAVALAMCSAALAVRGRSAWVWSLVLALAFLAESGLFAVLATTVGVIIVTGRSAVRGSLRPSRRDLGLAGGLGVLGVAGTALGYVIATRHPIDYYTVSDTATALVDVGSAAHAVASFVPAWLVSPLVAPVLIRPTALPWLVVLVADRLVLVAVAAAVVAGLIVVQWRRRHRDDVTERRWRHLFAAGLLLVPVVECAVVLAVTRAGSGLEPRYAILWLLPTAAAWAVLLQARSPAAWLRVASALAAGLLALSAIWCAIALPWTFRSAFDIDKERWDSSANQVVQIQRCRDEGAAVADQQVAPGLRDDLLCQVVRFLDSR